MVPAGHYWFSCSNSLNFRPKKNTESEEFSPLLVREACYCGENQFVLYLVKHVELNSEIPERQIVGLFMTFQRLPAEG